MALFHPNPTKRRVAAESLGNGSPTEPIELEIVSTSEESNTVRAQTKIKTLAKRFKKGINTMEVAYIDEADNERRAAEVVLEIQF